MKCNERIKKYHLNHSDLQHNCKLNQHRCSNQCPECKSFCNKLVNHDGYHATNTHRNKENCVFVSNQGKKTVSIFSDGKRREYKIGESCLPENCSSSCGRKGRSHFHLKPCLGGENCQARMNPFVSHSVEKYHPFEDKVFDKWLCYNYWESYGWEAPVTLDLLEEIQSCNFYCSHSTHGDEKKFCEGKAWHDGNHIFHCDHPIILTNIIDVVFCCDTTGSMDAYIDKSIDTILRIIEMINVMGAAECRERSIQFGFVAYRDHPPEDETYVTKYQNMADYMSALAFIQDLEAKGGGDGPEAVLDGLYDSIHKMNWRDKSLRFIFHIADAPPHGIQYTGGGNIDGFPEGCPCQYTIDKIASDLKQYQIKYKLLKIGTFANKMAEIFKSKIEDYELQDLDSALQMDIKVAEMVIRDIRSEEFDVIDQH
ncbi:UNKNOWN [Stylonychia lemnae]|uniref:VWFA domain-containing protein n=1 Tax=Stylonychia lemnae TaxID=5949 RepID=A0A078ASG5_STYLE|nr:UNKNOWN [Stylonychia lemnae]|eukprot:CDW83833.1 UNKNOWN [Stylonychia lemnae]